VFGYRADELVGQPLDLLIPERFRAGHRGHVERFTETGTSTRAMGAPGTLAHVDLAARRRDGSEFPIEASISQVVTDGGTYFTVILRDVTAQRHAEQDRERLLAAERRAARSARLLQSLTAGFSAVLTPAEVVDVVLEQAVDALGARTGLVAQVVDEGRTLELVDARGYAPEQLEPFRRAPVAAPSVIGAVARTGEPRWLTDPETTVRDYPVTAAFYGALGIQATAGLPLVDGRGRVFGVLAFNFDTPRGFDAEERALLSVLAHQCAQALERARLFEAERAAREEAQQRRTEAEEANAAKSRFLATTSHEIRTPINAILGYAELLEMGIGGPLADEQRHYVQRLRSSGRHLLGVINQVLDLSKIEAEKVELHPAPAVAAAAAGRAVALVEPQAVARSVALTNACEPASELAYTGDPERVEQILVNLVMNAVKFTPSGGRVTVTCGQARTPAADAEAAAAVGPYGWTYFRIEDTGIGVPADRLHAIWEPFEQADGRHTRTYGGTGLGLTISRRLARLMGGDITVRSRPGEGSTFFVWLPAAAPAAVADAGAAVGGGDRRRGGTRFAQGLGKAADAALAEIERVLSGYAARLRTDPETPTARTLSEADLEDHTATFLADVAQCLSLIEAAQGGASEAMRDASAIQCVIAERHGAQRGRLGCGEAEVRREFAILREELAAAVRRRVGREPDVDVEQALALFAHFLALAERTSLQTHGVPPTPER
jgi:PAS domain S-box-containing protein